MRRSPQQLICVNCSSNDEKNNPRSEDIELISVPEERFDDEDAEFERGNVLGVSINYGLRQI
ncbi:MAG: hypothetical protein QXY15_10740 [Candidatus Nitrosotenuis sp.]